MKLTPKSQCPRAKFIQILYKVAIFGLKAINLAKGVCLSHWPNKFYTEFLNAEYLYLLYTANFIVMGIEQIFK